MKTYLTSDLPLAAYLMMKSIHLISAEKMPTGRFEFKFDDPDAVCMGLALEFVNSDFCKFDNHVRNLKKILYRK